MNLTRLTALTLTALLTLTGCSKHDVPAEPKAKAKPADDLPKPPPGRTVFNSFDAHNKYDKGTAWAVMNSGGNYRGQAEWFSPAESGPLNTVDLALKGQGPVNITVATGKNGLPGQPLETFAAIPVTRYSRGGHLVLISVTHPALQVGTKYWLCAEPAGPDTACSWAYNNQNLAQGFAYDRAPGGWSFMAGGPRNGAFHITVVPPAP